MINKIGDSATEPERPEIPGFDIEKFTQDLYGSVEQDESGEVDIPVDIHATFSECLLAFEPC